MYEMQPIKLMIALLIVVVMLVCFVYIVQAQELCNHCTDEHCAKIEAPPWTFNVEAWGANESYIRRVEIKAGSGDGSCTVFTGDGNNGCYAVTGIGGKVATAWKVGSGPECHDISHILVYWWSPALPSLTPTATATDVPTSTPSATNTPPPDATSTRPPRDTPAPIETPTPTPTLPMRWTPTPTAPATPTKPVITLTTPPTPFVTPTPVATPTPRPNPKIGTMRGYLRCVYSDGSIGPGYGTLNIETNNIGVVGGIPWPDGYVGSWYTARDVGTTILSAGPGECFRGGDDYPDDLTEYSLERQPVFGAGNVGNSAVVCKVPCVDTSTFYLPESGGVRTRSNRR